MPTEKFVLTDGISGTDGFFRLSKRTKSQSVFCSHPKQIVLTLKQAWDHKGLASTSSIHLKVKNKNKQKIHHSSKGNTQKERQKRKSANCLLPWSKPCQWQISSQWSSSWSSLLRRCRVVSRLASLLNESHQWPWGPLEVQEHLSTKPKLSQPSTEMRRTTLKNQDLPIVNTNYFCLANIRTKDNDSDVNVFLSRLVLCCNGIPSRVTPQAHRDVHNWGGVCWFNLGTVISTYCFKNLARYTLNFRIFLCFFFHNYWTVLYHVMNKDLLLKVSLYKTWVWHIVVNKTKCIQTCFILHWTHVAVFIIGISDCTPKSDVGRNALQ